MLAPSRHTRNRFREYLVGTTLGYIDDVFSAASIDPAPVPSGRNVSGARRHRVEEYYAGIEWGSAPDVTRLLRVYEEILAEADQPNRDQLRDQLARDGLRVDDRGRILPSEPLRLGHFDAVTLADPETLHRYERRLLESVGTDPELAIGSAKELVEAACNLVLGRAGVEPDQNWTAEQLFTHAAGSLDLSVGRVSDARAGADSIRKALRSLHEVVVATAELRNRFGTGHGRVRPRSGLSERHARLAAGAALTVTRFLLETLAERALTTTRGSVDA